MLMLIGLVAQTHEDPPLDGVFSSKMLSFHENAKRKIESLNLQLKESIELCHSCVLKLFGYKDFWLNLGLSNSHKHHYMPTI
jgi:hypothetical protein